MESFQIAVQAAKELSETLSKVDKTEVTKLVQAIRHSKRIFLTGAGRSRLMLQAFAMRLMHIGFQVYIVGEVTTPAFLAGDLLIAASASGETKSILQTARKAKEYQGQVAVFSIFPESSLGETADILVKIPAYTDKLPSSAENKMGILPGGSMFEEAVLLLGDALIVELASEQHVDTSKAFANHANLE
ncbi:6-phospho-3-hexuloisomerase [Enterococcus alishanensis]